MTPEFVIQILREALMTAFWLARRCWRWASWSAS